jgi:hypothetical protein
MRPCLEFVWSPVCRSHHRHLQIILRISGITFGERSHGPGAANLTEITARARLRVDDRAIARQAGSSGMEERRAIFVRGPD